MLIIKKNADYFSTLEAEALRKLKLNPLKNSHCLKCDTNIEPKKKIEFAQVLGILGLSFNF